MRTTEKCENKERKSERERDRVKLREMIVFFGTARGK